MTTQFLKLPQGTIAYDDIGQGPLVVGVPGMGAMRQEYRFLAPQFASAGYRFVSMDVRGHGETSVEWPDYSIVGIGSDILALIRSLDAGPAVIYGNSMAAAAAVWAAVEAPELVSGLVLSSPFVRGDSGWQDGLLRLLFRVLFARPWGPSAWKRYYTSLYPTHKPDDFPAYVDALRRNLAEPGRLESLLGMLQADKAAAEARLRQVQVPALVLMGSKDPDFKDPAAEARWVAAQVNGQVHLIEGAGHYPYAELPEVTGPLTLAFLQSLKEKSHVA